MKLKLCILFIFICTISLAQHISAYSQYMFNTLLINPAYAGSNDALSMTALYRHQWVGIDGAPKTTTLSAHTPFKNKKLNAGMVIANDRAGICDHNRAALMYTYRIKAGKGNLAFGLQGGINSFRQNWQNVSTVQSGDAMFETPPTRNLVPEAGFGIYYHSKHFFSGAALPYILISDKERTYLPANLYSGALLKVSDNFFIKPTVLVKYIRNSPLSLDLNSTFYWKDIIGIGLGYRMNDAAMALLDLRLNEQLHIGYCYDYTLSRLNNYSNGSHEFMIRYLFYYKLQPSKGLRYF